MKNRRTLERRALLVLLLVLTATLVGIFAYDKSGRDDFWLAGACVAFGIVFGRLFWTVGDEPTLEEQLADRQAEREAAFREQQALHAAPLQVEEPSEQVTERHAVVAPEEEWTRPT